MIIANLLMIPRAMVLGTPGAAASTGLRAQLSALICNPVVAALVAALIVAGTSLVLPAPV